jgi:hypothetical protein
MPNYMTKKLVPFVVAAILTAMNLPLPALAKPIKIAEGVSFDLEACRRTLDGNDVICTGTLLSRIGERNIIIGRDPSQFDGVGKTYITTSQGKTYVPSVVSVGEQVCQKGAIVGQFAEFDCGFLRINLVEGVKYSSSFLFRDVSSSSSQIALLLVGFGDGYQSLKYRNLSIFQMR